jgi:hypothetical protein
MFGRIVGRTQQNCRLIITRSEDEWMDPLLAFNHRFVLTLFGLAV